MIYFNDVAAGGATRFKAIDKTVQPERGKLLCWNNRLADGTVNPATLHQAMKVRKSHKYLITSGIVNACGSEPDCVGADVPSTVLLNQVQDAEKNRIA